MELRPATSTERVLKVSLSNVRKPDVFPEHSNKSQLEVKHEDILNEIIKILGEIPYSHPIKSEDPENLAAIKEKLENNNYKVDLYRLSEQINDLL